MKVKNIRFLALAVLATAIFIGAADAQIVNPGGGGGGGTGTVTSITPGNCLTSSPNPVVATGTISLGTVILPETGTYQVLAADFSLCKTITVASGTFTITLVASGSQPANGTYINIVNYGSGVVTIARSGQNINGGTSSLTLPAASATAPTAAQIWSDGTNYFTEISGAASGAVVHTPTTGASMTFTGASTTTGTVDAFIPTAALSANVTSSTCGTFTPGQQTVFMFTQDGTGGRTVATCTSWDPFPISPTASKTTTLSYTIDASGFGHLDGASNDTATVLYGSERTAPATPASGGAIYYDSVLHSATYVSNTGLSSSMVPTNAQGLISPIGLASTGTQFTISGCSASVVSGGATAGRFTSGTTGTCTVVITMNGATGVSATNGWACWANDITTTALVGNRFIQTATSTTTATLQATTVSGDNVIFGCIAY